MSPVKTLKAITKTAVIIMISAVVVVAGAVTAMVVLNVGEELYRVIKMFELNGSADVERTSAGTISAYAGMNLENGDTLYVKENSSARISLDSDKYITLDQNTVMELVAEGNDTDSLTRLNLAEGTILNEITQPLSGNSVYEVNTPKATMAVRGTSYSVSVVKVGNEYLTELNVFHGNVAVQLYDENGDPKGDPVLVPEGKRVNIITEPNEKSGKDPALDGNSFFVFVDEEGNITPCGNSDPVTDIMFSGISDVILKQLLSSHNEKTLILSTAVADNILIAIENSNSDSDVSQIGTTTESSVFEEVTTVSESGSDEPTVTTVPEEYTQTDNYSETTWVTTQTSATETTTVTTVPQSEETEEETTVTALESEETSETTQEPFVTERETTTKETDNTSETKHTTTAPYTTGSSGYTTTYTGTSATSVTTVTFVTSSASLIPFTSETEETTVTSVTEETTVTSVTEETTVTSVTEETTVTSETEETTVTSETEETTVTSETEETTETTETELIPIDDAEVILEYTSTVYNGQAQKPAVTVKLDGAALGAGTDYTVSYANNKNAGTATVTITGTGDYTGSASAAFTIEKADPDIGTVSVKNVKVFTSTSPDDIILGYANTEIAGTIALDETITTFDAGDNNCGWIFTPTDTANYNSLTGSIVINAVVAEATGITATPDKSSKKYTYGTDTFDLADAGIAIEIEYEDGSTEDITDSADLDLNPNFTIGQTEVEITYESFTCSVGVDIYYTINYTASYDGTPSDDIVTTVKAMIGDTVASPIAPSNWSEGTYDLTYAVRTYSGTKYLLYEWDGADVELTKDMLGSTGTYTVEVPYIPAASKVEVTITKDGDKVSAELVDKGSSYTLPDSSENGFKGWGVYQSGGWYGTGLNPGASGGTNSELDYRRKYDSYFRNAGESITIYSPTELFEIYVYTVTFHNSDGTVLSNVETLGGASISNTADQYNSEYYYQYVRSALSAAPALYTSDVGGVSYGTRTGDYHWTDSDGNVFDENTVITGDIDVTLTPSEYTGDPISIEGAEVDLEYTTTVYNGSAQEPSVSAKLDGTALRAGTDYTVSYANNKNAGTATVTITGKGDYTGSASATFTIEKADLDIGSIGTVSVKNAKVFTSTSPADIILGYTNTEISGTIVLDETTVTEFVVGENNCGWIFTPTDTNYNGLTGSIVINAVEASVVGITATPDKSSKKYTYGTDTFDLAAAGIDIELEYEDGSTKVVTDPTELVFDKDFTIGQTEVEISYADVSCSVGVDIYYTVKYTASYEGILSDDIDDTLETAYGMIGYSVVSPIAPSIWSEWKYDREHALRTKTESDGTETKYLLYKWDGATIVLDEAMLGSTGTYTVEVPYVLADSIVEVTITRDDGYILSTDLVEKNPSYTLPNSSENGFVGWGICQSGWSGTGLKPGASGSSDGLDARRGNSYFRNAGESITLDRDTELFKVYVYTVTFHNSDGTDELGTVKTLGGETIYNTANQYNYVYYYQYVKDALSAAPELYTADIDGHSYGTAADNYRWVDSGGNVFDENTVITGDIDVYAETIT